MTSELRFVFDTNVLISTLLLPQSVPRRAFDLAQERGKLLISAATIEELNSVLRRPRFDKYLREDDRLQFLAALVRESEVVQISEAVKECRDPKDDKFLELALNGKATCIVSGDADLLALNPFRGISVLTPQALSNHPELR